MECSQHAILINESCRGKLKISFWLAKIESDGVNSDHKEQGTIPVNEHESVSVRSKTITGRHAGPHLLITGGVHGDEFEPMAAIRRLILELQPDDLRGRVTLVPVVNEAAFLRGHRMADDGLDLARVCPGSADGTVTERTAHELAKLIRAADFYIDLHTGGTELAVFPLAGYCLHPQPEILEQQRQMARAFNLPVIWGTVPTLEGRSLSIARHANVPAIYAEYYGSATCDPEGISAYVDGCLNVMCALQMIDGEPPVSKVEQVVEDPRPDSGHMQVCNPSPLTGFFSPAVGLGAAVDRGDVLGTVTELLGSRQQTIRAEQTGIVLVLRTFPRVREGESVGVILETNKNRR